MTDFNEDDDQIPKYGQVPEDDAEGRVSIGQLIAGVKQPSAMPAQPQDADAAPQVKPQFDPKLLPDSVRPPDVTPSEVPAPPTGHNNPNLTDLAKQQAEFGKPLDKNAIDPKTGKPMYKMGIGQRILGTIGNALNGFAGNHAPVVHVGPGATNWRFGRDEATREANLENVNTQIGTQEKLDSENEKMYRDAIRQAYDTQVGEARKGTAAAQQQTADVKDRLAESQRLLNEAKANKADQEPEPKTEAEIAIAYQNAVMKGDKQKAQVYRGALDELKKQKAAGKDTSAGDIAKALGVAKFRSEEHDKVNKDQEAERVQRYGDLNKDFAVKYSPEKMAAAKAQIDKDLETKYAPRHQKADQDADQMLDLTKSGGGLKTGGKPSAAASKIDPNNLPQTVMVNGKSRKVTGWNPQTKKVIVAAEGQ